MSSQELLLDVNEFFAPVSTDLISSLIARYNHKRKLIDDFLEIYKSTEAGTAIGYFCQRDGARAPTFERQQALIALNSEYWSEILSLTDIYNSMPQKRRDAWYEQMNSWRKDGYVYGRNPEHDLPEFNEDTVRDTIGALLADRPKFFAERVDGVFRKLSREHVTNCPEGFSKRMILGYVHNGSYEHHDTCGYINDLRCVVAKFMGREDPIWASTSRIIKEGMRRWGEWVYIDGGALKIRIYKKGTAHFEVHPDMAWRLNGVLASIYPMAIPESFRRKPVKSKPTKEWPLIQRPLPFQVIDCLSRFEKARIYNKSKGRDGGYDYIENSLECYGGSWGNQIVKEANQVIEAIGGIPTIKNNVGHYYQFDYDPSEVLGEIICSGCIPDHKSHQYYPTPERLAKLVVEIASKDVAPNMNWLEPSAGTGHIADLMPEDANISCYEISELHCSILKSKGYDRTGRKTVKCLDFLKLASEYRGGGYDRIVMNPPFSEGRWLAHLEGAAKCLKKGGRLVAILPSGAKNKDVLPGFKCSFSYIYENEFSGTSVNVVILTAEKI